MSHGYLILIKTFGEKKMKKHNIKVELVCTDVVGLSSMSKRSRDALLLSLQKCCRTVSLTVVSNAKDLSKLTQRAPDLIVLGLKYIYEYGEHAERIWLSEYLDKQGLEYCGSKAIAHKLDHHKHLAKRAVSAFNIDTPKSVFVDKASFDHSRIKSLRFPLFIKPACSGGGSGIDEKSVVNNMSELKARGACILADFPSGYLIEEYLTGREFSVAILMNSILGKYEALPVELVAPRTAKGHRILGQNVKTGDQEKVLVVTDVEEHKYISEFALNCFQALGGRDYGRVDIRMDAAGNANFLEANLIPSLIEGYGTFPKACLLNRSLSHDNMTEKIVALGVRLLSSRLTFAIGNRPRPIKRYELV